jgi:hypothetical protein
LVSPAAGLIDSKSRRAGGEMMLSCTGHRVDLGIMSLAEIKDAVTSLSPDELAELTAFILGQDPDEWDKQMERDAAAGKLDFLIEEADRAEGAGTLKDWPPVS